MSATEHDLTRPRPAGSKRARTRSLLIKAAAQLVRERGFEQTRLQDIAERAGMTVGAIYGNFKNRDELFMALAEAFWPPVKPRVRPRSTLSEIMEALADATIEAAEERRAVATTRLAGLSYALTNEDVQRRVQEVTTQNYEVSANWLRNACREPLPMEPELMVRIIHCLVEGLLFQRFLTPDLITDEVIYTAFAAISANSA